MDSITKTKVNQSQLETMVKRAFGDHLTLHEVSELTEGYFNTGYLVTTSDQNKSVLKIGPLPGVQVMRYEKDIMDMEVMCNQLVTSHPTHLVIFFNLTVVIHLGHNAF